MATNKLPKAKLSFVDFEAEIGQLFWQLKRIAHTNEDKITKLLCWVCMDLLLCANLKEYVFARDDDKNFKALVIGAKKTPEWQIHFQGIEFLLQKKLYNFNDWDKVEKTTFLTIFMLVKRMRKQRLTSSYIERTIEHSISGL